MPNKSISIKLKGQGARNFMASFMVDAYGEAAIEKCSEQSPMREAVKAILTERQKEKSHDR